MKYIGSKVLESENLILRPIKEEDLKVIWNILCDVDVAKYYLVGKINYNWDQEKEWQYKKLERALNDDVFQWSIILKTKNEYIGQVRCQSSYDESGNKNNDSIRDVGWFLDSRYQGMGFGTEAAKLMLDYMFYEVGIEKIETCAAIENPASWKIMEKFGFRRLNKTKLIKYTIQTKKTECYCYEITKEKYTKSESKIEYLNLYDNKKNKTNKKIIRGERLNIGDHILIAVVFIKNKDGKYLIQKTSKEKGGLYSSTGGHVLYNETSKDAITRELKEELGIEIKKEKLKYIDDILLGIPFADIYYLEEDIDINKLSLQKEEVDSVSYMSEDEIYNLILQEKMTKSHGLIFMNYFMNIDSSDI